MNITARALRAEDAVADFQRGAGLLDLRPKPNFVVRHIPGAIHLELDEQLSNRVGMLLSPDVQLVLMLENPADYERVAYMLARVGVDNVAGYLENLDDWEAKGYPVTER